MAVLVVADCADGELNDATLKTITAAKAFDAPIEVLVAGAEVAAASEAASKLEGVARVRVASHAALGAGLAEPLAQVLATLKDAYSAILFPASSTGKNVAPRLAALCDVQVISGVTKILAPDTFERPIYAGNAIQTVRSRDALKILTLQPARFTAAASGGHAPTEPVALPDLAAPARFVSEEKTKSERPELGSAKVVVSGGRALGSAEQFKALLEPLADRLGAAIGASRAAVDAGYAPNDWQVGQTGKVVAPALYIALGISGAIQHLAGMKDAKIIVAINKDPDAPIFQVADFGLVADIFEAVPELVKTLPERAA
jgi:electron transfer flavoprotein alpha subunit